MYIFLFSLLLCGDGSSGSTGENLRVGKHIFRIISSSSVYILLGTHGYLVLGWWYFPTFSNLHTGCPIIYTLLAFLPSIKGECNGERHPAINNKTGDKKNRREEPT